MVVVLLVAAQVGVSLLARTHRMHGYLIAHLERAFGRPVEVGRFSVQILPIPEVDAEEVTIGEDPAFGHDTFASGEHGGELALDWAAARATSNLERCR